MKELTDRQQQILNFILEKQDSERLAPTLREIAARFRFSSPNAALCHVQALLAKGFLKNLPGRARTLQVVAFPESRGGRRKPAPSNPTSQLWNRLTSAATGFKSRIVSVPIYGTIPAGVPIDAVRKKMAACSSTSRPLASSPPPAPSVSKSAATRCLAKTSLKTTSSSSNTAYNPVPAMSLPP